MEYKRLKDIKLRDKLNTRVFIQFVASNVSVRLQKDKIHNFIAFNMVDKDTKEEAVIFGATQSQIDMVTNGKVYNAAVDIKPYDKAPNGYSCVIYNIEPSSTPPEYFANWAEGLEECQQALQNVINDTIGTVYGKITYAIISKYWGKFSLWTAAKSQHHNILGGLLSHTAEVVQLADLMCDFFNNKYGEDFVNRELLESAAAIHDVGKVQELLVDTLSGNTEYSVEASLSSHIMNILAEVDIEAYRLGIGYQQFRVNELNEEEPIKSDEQLKEEIEEVKLLKHCLAAHHGKLEWGSPIEPAIPEAYILHKMDEISAEMYRYNRIFKDMESGTSQTVWSNEGMKSTYKENNK